MSEGSFTGEIHCHQINKNILYGEDLSKQIGKQLP